MTDNNKSDELPGNYSTVDGLKKRARALDQPAVAEIIETIEDTVERDPESGYYSVEGFKPVQKEHGDAGALFYLGVLVGCALEREYPGRPYRLDNDCNNKRDSSQKED